MRSFFVGLVLMHSLAIGLTIERPIQGQENPVEKNSKPTKPSQSASTEVSGELQTMFGLLDELGRGKVADAKFVELKLSDPKQSDHHVTDYVWLLSEQNDSVTVLRDDLLPWTYSKRISTVPASWEPSVVILESITEADFETYCKKVNEPADETKQRRLGGPGASHRALIAHAAWKKGLSRLCNKLIAPDQEGKNFKEYRESVLDDLAWLHFLRGVNLLMFAKREDVIPHLRLVSKVSPKGEHAASAKDLADRLEKFIAENKGKPAETVDESKMTDQQRAEYYVSQFVELRCPQMAQPGFIIPYLAIINGEPNQDPPTAKLRAMELAAVPALLKALEDDTPTRTVYHWRDFAHSRLVWRVSDFAWTVLRDISKKELGYRRMVGFTLSSMSPDEKRQAIKEAQAWYAQNKNASPDERMLTLFSSGNPEDWITAGKYFQKNKDARAVAPLLEKIPRAKSFDKGNLCEVVAEFGDAKAKPVLQEVMRSASEHADRLDAAIALWTLGDNSGIPVVIEFVKAKEQPYGTWQEPIWFLIRSKSPDGLAAIKTVIAESPKERMAEVMEAINSSITGDLWSERKPPAGCVEICPLLIVAMDRPEYTGGTINDNKIRVKDTAARALVAMRHGVGDHVGRFDSADPKLFDQLEPDEKKRDVQIDELKKWYEDNKNRLVWDSKQNKLAVKVE